MVYFFSFFFDFNIKFIEGFDVIIGEGDGNEINVFGVCFGVIFNGCGGLRFLLGFGIDFGLLCKMLRVGEVEFGYDGLYCSGNFGSVWVIVVMINVSVIFGYDWV